MKIQMINSPTRFLLVKIGTFFSQNPLIIGSMLQVECVFFALCSLTLVYQVLVCLARYRIGPVDKS